MDHRLNSLRRILSGLPRNLIPRQTTVASVQDGLGPLHVGTSISNQRISSTVPIKPVHHRTVATLAWR